MSTFKIRKAGVKKFGYVLIGLRGLFSGMLGSLISGEGTDRGRKQSDTFEESSKIGRSGK